MRSSVSEESLPKGYASIKINQRNLSLITANRDDLTKRGKEILPMLITMHVSRWEPLFGGDWDCQPETFKGQAFALWALEPGERMAPGWAEDIAHLTTVADSRAVRDTKTLVKLLSFNFGFTDGLVVADFDEAQHESRSSKNKPCSTFNSGISAVLRRIEQVMMGFMAGAYEDSFTEMIRFLTLNEQIY
jgi:hypothetical protein